MIEIGLLTVRRTIPVTPEQKVQHHHKTHDAGVCTYVGTNQLYLARKAFVLIV